MRTIQDLFLLRKLHLKLNMILFLIFSYLSGGDGSAVVVDWPDIMFIGKLSIAYRLGAKSE